MNLRKLCTIWVIFLFSQAWAQNCLKHVKSSTKGDNAKASPFKLASADFNTDGKDDLATIYDELTTHITVLLSDGKGSFLPEILLQSNDSINDITSADYNNDGKKDIAIVSTNNYTFEITVFLSNGDGTFETAKTTQIQSSNYDLQMYEMISADFNNDGSLDIATASYTEGISILLGNGDGSFVTAKSFFARDGLTSKMIVADFNNDRNIDLATTNMVSDSLLVFLGKGDGTFETPLKTKLSYSMSSINVADFDTDGNIDLVEVGYSNAYVYKGNGDGTFSNKTFYKNISGDNKGINCADYNGDGTLDIAINSRTYGLVLLYGKGDFTFSTFQFSESDASSVIRGDFNGDKNPDIAFIYGLYDLILTDNIWVFFKGNPPSIELGADQTVCPSSNKTLDAGAGFTYIWGNGSQTQTYTVTKSGTYSVTITDPSSNCMNSDSIKITILQPFSEPEAVATVFDNNRVVFAWYRTSGKNTLEFIVERETNAAGIFKAIGKKTYSESSYVVDSNVNVNLLPYRYRLRTVNECYDTADSKIHKTMLLQVSYNKGSRVNNLLWNGYEGISLSTYHIFRNGSEINSLAASSSNNIYRINDGTGIEGDSYYISYDLPDSIYTDKIKFDSGPFSISLSNMAESQLTNSEVNKNEHIEIFPNPAHSEITISFKNNIESSGNISMYNSIGQKVKDFDFCNNNQKVNLSDLTNGIYHLVIKTKDDLILKNIEILK